MVWVGVGDFCFSFSGVAAVLGSWLGWSGQKTFDLDWIFDHCNCWRLLAVQLPAPVNTSYRPSINYLVLGTARTVRERQGKGGQHLGHRG